MTLDLVINALIFICTAVCYVLDFRQNGVWSWKNGVYALRFFTLLSNLFCACACLAVVLSAGGRGLPFWVWILKYIGTSAVTVTLLTVMVFLGPALGYKNQLSGAGFYYHLVVPLLFLYPLLPLFMGLGQKTSGKRSVKFLTELDSRPRLCV